jgi:hypothetical protein
VVGDNVDKRYFQLSYEYVQLYNTLPSVKQIVFQSVLVDLHNHNDICKWMELFL